LPAFLIGSVACGASTTMLQLIAARAVQGLGPAASSRSR
jgi:MFS family permease